MEKKSSVNEILLILSIEISCIRSREDMLHLISHTLKEYIHFDDCFVLLYNENTKTCKPYIYHAGKKRLETPGYKFYVNLEYPVIDDSIEGLQEPVVTDIESLMLDRSEQVDFMYVAGIKEFVTIKLVEGNKLIGLFVLLSEEKQSFTALALELLQNISYQVAIVTANLIADEEITNRNYEQTMLLSLSNEIAAVRDKNDLLQVLNVKLKELFPIIGFGITLQNEDGISHSPFVVDSDSVIRNDVDFKKVITLEYSIEDGVYNVIVNKSEPVLLNVDEVTPMVETAAYVAFWKKLNVKHVVGNALSVAGKNIGCLIFLLENDTTQKINHELMKGVCSAVSVAVANIKYLEEIIKKDQEKTILLSLSNEITTIRNEHDLNEIMNDKLKELFSVKEYGIAKISEDGNTFSPFILDLHEQRKNHPHFKKIAEASYSVKDPVFSRIIKSTDPVFFNVDELAKEQEVSAFVFFWQKVGYRQVVGLPLRVGGKDIGIALLHIDNNSIKRLNSLLLKGVFSQISVAVSNIFANEDILKREEEKTMLLNFSNEVAGLRTRDDFFPIVNSQLKKIFSLERFGIANINEDRKTHNAFMVDLGDSATNDVEFEYIMTTKYDIHDPVFGGIMNSHEPVLLDVDELALDASLPIYVGFWKKVGFKFLFCVQLRVGGNDIGVIFFDIDHPNSIQHIKTNLLKGISAQIAVAVSNILANEDITRREKERELLLSLNMDMVAVRTTEELMKLINHRLKTLLNFSHTHLCKINEDKTTITPYLYDPNSSSKSHPRYHELKGSTFPINDGIMNKSIATSFPVLTELDDLKKQQEMPLYVIINYDSGIRQIVTVRFTRGHKPFGFWMIFFDKRISLNPAKSSLIKGIADGMSIAVSNIIANEEIYVREKEKTRLLEFSNAMASVKDKKLLGRILKQHLKELFSIDFYVIHALSEDKKTFRPTFYDPDADFAKHPDFMSRANMSHEVKGIAINKILKSENSLSFPLEKRLGNLTSKPYLAFLTSRQVNRITSVRIRLGEENIGIFDFNQCENNPTSIQQNLFKSICSQIAINLSNTITNDEIINREQEKSLLLEFTNNIAAIRDRFLLAKVITDQLNKLFGIIDYAIFALSDDKKTHSPIVYDPDADFAKTPVFQQMIAQPSDVNDGVFNNVLKTTDTITFTINDWVHSSRPPTYTEAAVNLGIVKLTGVALRLGDQPIAVMQFRHDDSHQFEINKQLFKSICSQLAIAVSNLITHDEIIRKEQEKSVLLAFSNNIAAIRDKFLLAKVLTDQLNKLFGIQDYAIHALSEDKKTHRPILYDPDAEITRSPVFQQMIAHPSDVNDGVFNSVLNSKGPVSFSINDWVHLSKPPTYTLAALSLGIVKLTGIAIRLGNEAIAVMNFRHDDSNRFEINKQLFKSICSQLATAVSNIIAKEKIENQLIEINNYKQQLEEEKIYLKEEIATTLNYAEIIGESPAIRKTFRLIDQVAASDSTVLLLGETGTGKELVARAIHNSSSRKNKLMVKLNCAALPANLIESELFGHERGSFTGAIDRRIGKFELANNSTLFLDEIGEMPLELQVKLLRALQEQEIERVGGKTTIKVDVRIIAATNRNLEKEMAEGRFRSDLYYRLNIFPINLPPLRNRKDDIPILASSFITRFSKKSGKQINNLSKKALEELLQYDWPGNIRELEHLVERSVLLTTGDIIHQVYLPSTEHNKFSLVTDEVALTKTIDDNEKEHILKILKHVKGRIAGIGGAAELLGVPPSTLNSKMKRLGIGRKFTA